VSVGGGPVGSGKGGRPEGARGGDPFPRGVAEGGRYNQEGGGEAILKARDSWSRDW